jgi:hypothetical protein
VKRVGRPALGPERGALRDAEAVLLVDDRKAKVRKFHVFDDERVRSDGEVALAARQASSCRRPIARAEASEERVDANPKGQEQRCKLLGGLRGQYLGRRHQRALRASARRQDDRGGGDERLSASDVALQEAIHRGAAPHVAPDLFDHAALRAGQRQADEPFELFQEPERRGQDLRPAGGASPSPAERRSERDAEKLLVDRAFARSGRPFGRRRTMQFAPGLAHRTVPALAQNLRRQNVVDERFERREVSLDQHRDRARRDLLSGAVDRHDRTPILFALVEEAMMEDVELDVDGASRSFDLRAPVNEEPVADVQLPDEAAPPEPRRFQAPRVVFELGADDRDARTELAELDDPANRDLFTRIGVLRPRGAREGAAHDLGDRCRPAPILIVARIGRRQVARGPNAEGA